MLCRDHEALLTMSIYSTQIAIDLVILYPCLPAELDHDDRQDKVQLHFGGEGRSDFYRCGCHGCFQVPCSSRICSVVASMLEQYSGCTHSAMLLPLAESCVTILDHDFQLPLTPPSEVAHRDT